MATRFVRPPRTAPYRYRRAVYRGKSISGSPRLRWGVWGAISCVLAVQLVFGEGGILRGQALQEELADLHRGNLRLNERIAELDTRVKLQENDPFSLEKLAREKYGMARPGERIYRFEETEPLPPDPLLVEP